MPLSIPQASTPKKHKYFIQFIPLALCPELIYWFDFAFISRSEPGVQTATFQFIQLNFLADQQL